MTIFGLSIEDWASVVGIVGGLMTLFTYLFKSMVFKPLKEAIDGLSKTVDKLSLSNQRQTEQIESEIRSHDLILKEHDVRIDKLEEREED